jgi:uncharacterized surface anchored protein
VEGRYVVREATPPPGYEPAGPWTIDIPPGGAIVLEVDDVATRGSLSLRKLDAVTEEPVAGAALAVHSDRDGDGTYESAVAEVTSALEPVVVPDLVPGPYRVVELAAPPGYELRAEPIDVVVGPGAAVEVVVADQPFPTTTSTTTTTTVQETTTSSAPTTSVPDATTSTAPATSPPVRQPRRALARTGVDPAGLGATGAGLVLLGTSIRPRQRRRS